MISYDTYVISAAVRWPVLVRNPFRQHPYNQPMPPDIAEAIRSEHNATLEAVHRAQARALHLGEILLHVRQELGPIGWETWLTHRCPIPASAARRYANEAKRLKQAA